MLETYISLTFPGFQRQMEWFQNFFTKMPLKPYKYKIKILPRVSWCVVNFVHPTTFNISIWF